MVAFLNHYNLPDVFSLIYNHTGTKAEVAGRVGQISAWSANEIKKKCSFVHQPGHQNVTLEHTS